MGKSYVADLRKWVEQKKGLNSRSANSARVVFLAIRDDVKEAIDAGYSLVTIWEHLHETGRVKTTYETFRRHVKRFISQPAAGTLRASQPAEPAEARKEKETKMVTPGKEVAPEKTVRKIAEQPPQTGLPSFKFEPIKKRGN